MTQLARSTQRVEENLARHLRHLAVEIGPRPIGSPANRAAARYVADALAAAGLAVAEHRFSCPDWREAETCLVVGGERLPAAANAFSPPCDVAAPTVGASTIAELEAADLAGRIAVLSGDLTANSIWPKGWKLFPVERDWRIVRILEEKRPAAIVTINPRPGRLDSVFEDWEFAIPSATVSAEDCLALLNRLGETISLRIATSSTPSETSTVVGALGDEGSPRIVLCAHYDTKFRTPGAADNAGGVALLLTLAETLAPRQRDLGVGLEFVAFTGEEYGDDADATYVAARGAGFDRVIAAINFDGVGHRLGSDSISLPLGSDALRSALDARLAGRPSLVWRDPWSESNHSTFTFRGVPAVAFTSGAVGHLCHLPTDTVEWVDVAKLATVRDLAAEIVADLAGHAPAWARG